MPFIQITILEGRFPEMKEKLILEVSHTVANVLEAPIETTRVLINEVSYQQNFGELSANV